MAPRAHTEESVLLTASRTTDWGLSRWCSRIKQHPQIMTHIQQLIKKGQQWSWHSQPIDNNQPFWFDYYGNSSSMAAMNFHRLLSLWYHVSVSSVLLNVSTHPSPKVIKHNVYSKSWLLHPVLENINILISGPWSLGNLISHSKWKYKIIALEWCLFVGLV